MMTKNIPYKWYKLALLLVWLFAALCVAATWVAFVGPGTFALIFGITVDVLLVLALAALVILFYINGRDDYKKRAIVFGALDLIHLIFFILVIALKDKLMGGNNAIYVLPVVHTIILICISVAGIYFWIRNKFTFKSAAKEDAQAAFGGPIEEPKPIGPQNDEDKQPKKARDEKTGIVSL